MKTTLFLLVLLFKVIGFAQGPIICDPPKDTLMRNGEIIYLNTDEPTQFPGGNTALKKYITEKFDFFPCFAEFPINGKCYLELIILSTGKIGLVTVVRGVPDCPECDKEAIRIAKSMPDWIPAKKNGVAVNSAFILPIAFRFGEDPSH